VLRFLAADRFSGDLPASIGSASASGACFARPQRYRVPPHETSREGSMPDTHETLSRTQHGDYSQATAIECGSGELRIVIEGPSARVELEVESPDDLTSQLRQLDQLTQAIAAGRAVLASLVDDVA
jgi:sarcosine oxidase gamma subunit